MEIIHQFLRRMRRNRKERRPVVYTDETWQINMMDVGRHGWSMMI